MKYQRFNLLTTLIVSALHPNEPQQAGTKWEPTNAIDIQEATDLCNANYAEKVDAAKGDNVAQTWLQRQDDAKRKTVKDSGFEPAVVPETETTPTNDDSDAVQFNDEELNLVLDGNVDQVTAELDGMNLATLERLRDLENARDKPRVGVDKAVTDAIEAIGPQE